MIKNNGENAKNSSVESQDGTDVWSSLISFYRERIESPLFITVLFCWLLINWDFVVYAFFYDAKDKANILTEWDFSGYLYPTELLSQITSMSPVFSENAKILYNPLILGVLFTLATNPITLLISGLRYKASRFAIHFATTEKNKYQVESESRIAQAKLADLEDTIRKQNDVVETFKEALINFHTELNQNVNSVMRAKLAAIFNFVLASERFFQGSYDPEKFSTEIITLSFHSTVDFYDSKNTLRTLTGGSFMLYLAQISSDLAINAMDGVITDGSGGSTMKSNFGVPDIKVVKIKTFFIQEHPKYNDELKEKKAFDKLISYLEVKAKFEFTSADNKLRQELNSIDL